MTNNIHFGMDNVGSLYYVNQGLKVIVDPLVRMPNEEDCLKGWLFSKKVLPNGEHYGIMKHLERYGTYQYKS